MLGVRDRAPVVPAPWADGSDAAQIAAPAWLGARGNAEFGHASAHPSSERHPIEGQGGAPQSQARGEQGLAQGSSLGASLGLSQGGSPAPALPAPAHDGPSADAAAVVALEAELSAMEAALADLAEKNRVLEAQLATMALSAETVRRQLYEGCERSAVELAVAVAERIVGRELHSDPGIVVSWIRQALEVLSDGEDLEVRVARDVFESVSAETWQAVGGGRIVPIVDPKLGPGSCEVTSAVSRIDQSLGVRVRAVVDALGTSEGRT